MQFCVRHQSKARQPAGILILTLDGDRIRPCRQPQTDFLPARGYPGDGFKLGSQLADGPRRAYATFCRGIVGNDAQGNIGHGSPSLKTKVLLVPIRQLVARALAEAAPQWPPSLLTDFKRRIEGAAKGRMQQGIRSLSVRCKPLHHPKLCTPPVVCGNLRDWLWGSSNHCLNCPAWIEPTFS